jgi:single-strand DNA-binding protein
MSVICFTGHLGQDPDVRYMPNGTAVAALSVADARYWHDKKSQEMKSHVEWHRVIIFGDRATRFAESANKGDLIEVHGELRYRKYDHEKGYPVQVTEIYASRTRILSRANGSKPATSTPSQANDNEGDLPLPQFGDDYDDSDDIPF